MGTYGVSAVELAYELIDCLDDIEGDFDKKNLAEAMEFLKGYCPTSDSTTKEEKHWRKMVAKMGDNE